MDDGEDGVVGSTVRRGDVDHREDLGHGGQRRRREGVEHAEQHRGIGIRPGQEEEGDSDLLSPENPYAEDDGDGAGNEERQGEEVDPPDPEHGGQLVREEEVDTQCAGHERDTDDVVRLTVMNGRLRPLRVAVHRRQDQRDDRNEAYVGQRSIEVRQLPERRQRVAVGDDDDADQRQHLHSRTRARARRSPTAP